MADIVNVHEAKTHLSSLLEKVKEGRDIILAKSGKPIARWSLMTKWVRESADLWKDFLTSLFLNLYPRKSFLPGESNADETEISDRYPCSFMVVLRGSASFGNGRGNHKEPGP